MEIITSILIYMALLFDITLLKKRALPLFITVFRFTVWQIATISVLLSLALLSKDRGFDILQVVLSLFILIYLLRRNQFLSLVKDSPEYAPVQDENLELALSSFSIIALWALGMLCIGLYVEIIKQFFHWHMDELAVLLFFSEISSLLFIVLIYRAVSQRKGLNLFQVLGLETKNLGGIKIWVIPAVFALGYALLTSWILDARPLQPITPLQDLLNSTTSMGVLIFFAGSAILTAPFFEEIIFRGFFFHVIKPYKGVAFAVIFIALVFGVLHVDQYWGDWGAIAVVGILGLSLTLLRAWTGSSVPGMIAHYVYNTSLMIIPVLFIVFSNPIYLEYQLNIMRLTPQKKEELLSKSIARHPEFSLAYNDLAWLYSEQGIKLERALELIDIALIKEPENYAFLDTKAEVLFKMGKVKQAVEIEEKLLEKYPHDSYLNSQLKKFSAFETSGSD